ncbi:hypothetical protein [Methylobacterium brachiatum]|uniref:hypothetical protein n=1 Tax=Methylobacterium brachiatum TaxID=269660 RepID=UPI00244BAB57|nr:hypothetical protein [Methylobacterium brachiatum]MDH2313328.1 hypothetical protein [Methylobacterium brachiatum]
MDLSKLSDDELQRLYQSAPTREVSAGAAPKADLAGMSDADLMKLHRGFTDAPAAAEAGDASAAIGRGLIEGVPVIGPSLLGGVNRAVAGVRALKNDTRYSDELANVERFGERTAAEHPIAAGAGEIGGGIVGTLPLMAAAPAAFGISGAALPARMAASAASGAGLGGADAAVRSGGDVGAIEMGAVIGGGLGAAGPGVGALAGRAVRAITGGNPGEHLLREAAHGLTESELAAAQSIREGAANIPGGPIGLSVGEALNAATGGRAVRASQLERVAANSGGEGARIAGDFYAARPAQVDGAGRAMLDRVGAEPASPTGLGFDVQAAARNGLMQAPEGQAFSQARAATGPRVTPEQAGRTIQDELRGVADGLEARRTAQAATDYAAARAAPETVGIERMTTVERPGEPVVTQQQYSRPQFNDGAPRPLEAFARPDAEAATAGPESLARFIARNGGIRLDGEAAATDLHRFNIPGHGNVARPTGKGIDDFWRERLIEEGYFRPDPDGGMARDISSELLRKLQNEQRGFPSYPTGTARGAGGNSTAGQLADDYGQAVSMATSRLREDLGKVGIDADTLHPEVRNRVVGSLVRGQHQDPIDAYEAVVGAMREQPAPFVKSTTVQEQIPDVRFGQVDPRPALAAVAEQGRTAKGDVRGALSRAGRDLLEPGGDLDMSVAGLLHARERLDFGIRSAQEIGDATKVRDLQATRAALDEQLKRVPEVATADANFAANSAPLEPYTGNNPLGRVVRRDDLTGRMATPAEQVPTIVSQPTAAREMLAQPAPNSRQALGRHVETQILDRAAGAEGDLSADTLRGAMREHADVLDALPEVRDRLSRLAVAREGMARIEASPLGQIAKRPDVDAATRALFGQSPGPGTHREVASAMQALVRNDAPAAESLARTYLETVFNEATQQTKGVASQYGGAGFASAIRGNAQQRHNLEAVVRALPNGETRWNGLDRLLTTLEATGFRPAKGSDTAFNHAIQKELASGKTHVGQAVSNVVTGMAAGAFAGGPKGMLAGGAVGFKHGLSEAMTRAQMLNSSEAVARLMFDPKALPDLRALAKSPPGSKNAELFTTRLLSLANAGLAPAREPAPQ